MSESGAARAARVKQWLKKHVRHCRNTDCFTCRKLRIRAWCLRHPLHCRLLDMAVFDPSWTPGQSLLSNTMLLREAFIREPLQLPLPIRFARLPLQSAEEWALGGETVNAVTLAQRQQDQGLAPPGSLACLVLAANEQWSPATHVLFPDAQRNFAVSLLMIGSKLSLSFPGEEQGMFDCWRSVVMPLAICPHP